MEKKTKTNRKLSILIKYLRPYKKTIIILALFAIAEHAVYLIAPTLFGKIVDIVIQEKVFSRSILALLAAWIILDLFANWFMRIKNKGAGNVAYKVTQDLVLSSVDHLVRLPLEFHRNKKTGEVIQRISRADEQLYEIVEEGLFYIIPNVLTSILAFGFILWIDWQLAIAYLVFIGLYIIATIKKTGPIIKYQHRLNHAIERIYGSILDRVPNIFNVKSNTAENLEHRRYHREFAIGNHYNYHQVKLWTNLSLWQSWVSAVSFVTLFGIGIYFVQLGRITVGQFVMLLTYINMVALLLSTLADYYKRFQEGMVAIARSEEIFKVKTENYDNPHAIPLEKCKGHVRFTRVHFSYPEKNNVLDGISFEAKAGQMIAIVGRSGQGKSTITNLIFKRSCFKE